MENTMKMYVTADEGSGFNLLNYKVVPLLEYYYS